MVKYEANSQTARLQEITRRVNLRGIWQAAYTAGVVLPKPVATAQYWHRSLNPKKLISVGFSRLAVSLLSSRHACRQSLLVLQIRRSFQCCIFNLCTHAIAACWSNFLKELRRRSLLLLRDLYPVSSLGSRMLPAWMQELPSSPSQDSQFSC